MKAASQIRFKQLFIECVALLGCLLVLSCGEKKIRLPCDTDLRIGNGLALHPTEGQLYISKPTGRTNGSGKAGYSLYRASFDANGKTSYEALPINSSYTDYHPVFSSDGQLMLFNSTRPQPDSNLASGKTDIWMSTYTKGSFSEPEFLNTINTIYHDSYPSLTRSNHLYFNSDRPGGKGMMDIYRSAFADGKWQTPVMVEELNSVHSENDLVVDPDEQFIIFNRYEAASKEIDLYISFREDNRWSAPQKIVHTNTFGVWELTPTLFFDKEFLFIEIDGAVKCFLLEEILSSHS